jgi:hypothetical protein
MTYATAFWERLQTLFKPTPRGVVGLVDNLLGLCRDQQLRFNFQDSHCYVRPLGVDAKDSIEVPLQKSVFRAVLARVAALCNERSPNSVTPYRGEGELAVCSNPPAAFHVAFTNTPSEQHLEVKFLMSSAGEANKFTALLRDKGTVTVYGHALKYVQNSSNPADYGSYGILSRVDGAEVFVALFRVSEVRGVFRGDISASSESA